MHDDLREQVEAHGCHRWNTATSDPTSVSDGATDPRTKKVIINTATAMPIKPGRSRMNWHTSSWGTWSALRNTTLVPAASGPRWKSRPKASRM